MVADFFTKVLQGSLFRKLRDMILNIKTEDGPGSMDPTAEPMQRDHRSVLKGVPTVEVRTWAQIANGSGSTDATETTCSL
jgi:hypothetical protein